MKLKNKTTAWVAVAITLVIVSIIGGSLFKDYLYDVV